MSSAQKYGGAVKFPGAVFAGPFPSAAASMPGRAYTAFISQTSNQIPGIIVHFEADVVKLATNDSKYGSERGERFARREIFNEMAPFAVSDPAG